MYEETFSGAQLNRLIPQRHLTQQQMDFQRANGDPFLQAVVATLQQGAASRCQLFQTERFAQHIISTVIEQTNNRVGSAACCENNDRAAQLICKAQR